jgi:hypothetical protein
MGCGCLRRIESRGGGDDEGGDRALLQFGAALQECDIDKIAKWVGDEAEKRLSEFFPSQDGEREGAKLSLGAYCGFCPSYRRLCRLVRIGSFISVPEKALYIDGV